MIAEVTFSKPAIFSATINLPASKSISNRALIIKAIGNLKSSVSNLSTAADTVTLNEILLKPGNKINAGDGGTTLRFLLAFLCLKGEETEVTASASLMKRPVAELVDALRLLGASVNYLEAEGRLPVKIMPSKLHGGNIAIGGETSSQFISAIMMIGPYLHGGLKIEITGEVLSLPYILMTKSIMEFYGAKVKFENNVIEVLEGSYIEKKFVVEPDWSAASYWYEVVALSEEAKITLTGLSRESLQGDAVISGMMNKFGVETNFTEEGAILTKNKNFKLPEYFTDDFSGCPDLGPAVAAVCGALNITADLTGLKNFRLKESDRAAAMQRELYNMNVKTDFCGGSKFKVYSGSGIRKWSRPVKTYNDHRIAMAFAPLAIKAGVVLIEHPHVVEKSYPEYFDDLIKVGFDVKSYLPAGANNSSLL